MPDSRYEIPRRNHEQGASYLDAGQTPAENMLIDRGVPDLLDEGYSPPDREIDIERFHNEYETLDERLVEEEPDPYASLSFGDDDGDDEPADENLDSDGDREMTGARSGRLIAAEDDGSDMLGSDVGIDGGAASAEEAAMHIVEDSAYDD